MERNEIFYGNSKEKYETPNLQIISALGTQGFLLWEHRECSPQALRFQMGSWENGTKKGFRFVFV